MSLWPPLFMINEPYEIKVRLWKTEKLFHQELFPAAQLTVINKGRSFSAFLPFQNAHKR